MNRYLGLPQEQPAAYRMGSVLPYVHNLSGRLLLIHGQVCMYGVLLPKTNRGKSAAQRVKILTIP